MMTVTMSFAPKKNQQLSLRDSAKWDFEHKARETHTGWGLKCKARTGPQSATQRRKATRRGHS